MSRVLAVNCVHERPDLVLQQALSYHEALDGEVTQFIHVNAACADKFFHHQKTLGVSFDDVPDLHVVSQHATAYAHIFHAQAYCVDEAIRRAVPFDKVIFHTSADLLFRPGVLPHVLAHDLGAAAPIISGPKDFWAEQIAANPVVHRLVSELDLEGVYRARVDGMFMDRETYLEAREILGRYYDFAEPSTFGAYPAEEADFVTVLEWIARRKSLVRTTNLVATSSCEKQLASAAEVQAVLASPARFGIKRFRQDLHDPLRVAAFQSLGIEIAR